MEATKKIELDLSSTPPLVKVDGVTLEGVSHAKVDVHPFELVVLTLSIHTFTITGGELPRPGWSLRHSVEDDAASS